MPDIADHPDSPQPEPEAQIVKVRKKRKTSRGLRDLQRAERRISKAAHRMSEAVAQGLATYRKKRDVSAAKKRDGALRDMPVNAAKGAGKALRKASRVPADLVRMVDPKTTRRLVRAGSRVILFPFMR